MAEQKVDPVGDEFYKPLLTADAVGDWLFYSSAALSIAALFVTGTVHPLASEIVQIAFALSVVFLFATTLAIRLHFFPRAQVRRYQDFLSHASGKPLSHKQTVAYYNNSATTPVARVAAQVLESAFFTKEVLSRMLLYERGKFVIYVVVWLIAVLYRRTDLALLGVAAQILFSEQILSRWLRLEWFRWRSERIYDELFTLMRTKAKLDTAAWDALGQYEIVKATSAISLSTRVFDNNRDRLGAEWEAIRKTLGL
jgi:hypothetical protein